MVGDSSARGRALLEGAIDLHLHAGPSLRKRTGDAWDAAVAGEAVGMRGALIKDHDRLTVADAELVNRRAGTEFEAFAAICLNAPTGGLNPAAVESAVRMGARAVFLPTDSAANDAAFWSSRLDHRDRSAVVGEAPRRWTDAISLLDGTGQLRPAARAVLEVCVAEDATICTGHLSADEVSAVLPVAAELGGRVVVTHAPVFTEASLDRLRGWADAGALLELVYIFCCEGTGLPEGVRRSVEGEAALIEAVGADRFVLSTDLGQAGNPAPVEGLAAFASGLLAEGIPETDVALMMRHNPARALGLSEEGPP